MGTGNFRTNGHRSTKTTLSIWDFKSGGILSTEGGYLH